MENEILKLLNEILTELKRINKKTKKIKKESSTEEKIEKFIDYILNFKSDGLTKGDLRASNIVDNVSFKTFWDENEQTIVKLMKERHNILLSRRTKGCYLFKRPCNV